MYFATDLEPIQSAMDASAPRPLVEVMKEQYPTATFDRNGRAHAPHDGYVDPIYGNIYRGGEYLPFEPSDDLIERGGAVHYPMTVMVNGDLFQLEGTRGQRRAGGEIAKDQAEEFDCSVAKHVGEVKKREVFELTLFIVFTNNDGLYGPSHTHYMRDQDGNPVVYKGSKKLPMNYGDTAKIKATVKSHWISSTGRKATYINRPVMEK